MKTVGNWVIKTSAGGYWCGNAHFDSQLRKAQVYHWKEAAEAQAETLKRRKYVSDNLEFEIVAITEPKELRDVKTATEIVYEFEARLNELLYTIPTVYNSHFRKLVSQVVERMLNEQPQQ